MSISSQEQLYNEIVEYYSYVERLIKAVEESAHELSEQQFAIVEDAVNALEDCADKIGVQYIEFIKSGESEKTLEAVRSSLNDIAAKISECRNKILVLYQEN